GLPARRWLEITASSKVTAIREKLDQDYPIVLFIQLPYGYYDSFLDANQQWSDPGNPQLSMSGHCVLAVGYSDARRALHVQDSQGPRFESNTGCWWLGYVVAETVIQKAYVLIR
ncbi:MAG: C39 family peptidase, partial [Acidobacteriales bacterium]|nr:C39 family peptidase [Terriglobales bacterium]